MTSNYADDIAVVGDPVVDWHITCRGNLRDVGLPAENMLRDDLGTQLLPTPGGAWMLRKLLRTIADGRDDSKLKEDETWKSLPGPGDTCTYAVLIWEPRRFKEQHQWRNTQVLGTKWQQPPPNDYDEQAERYPRQRKVLVLYDMRGLEHRAVGPSLSALIDRSEHLIYAGRVQPKVVRKLSRWKEKLTLTMSMGALFDGRLPEPVSIEATVEETMRRFNERSYEARCSGAVVWRHNGAVMLFRRSGWRVFWDKDWMISELERRREDGRGYGHGHCIAASLVDLLLAPTRSSKPDFGEAVKAGMFAHRLLHAVGGGSYAADSLPVFPCKQIASEIAATRTGATQRAPDISEASVPARKGSRPLSFLSDLSASLDAYPVARKGAEALGNVPVLSIDKDLVVVDRSEIEAYMNFGAILRHYRWSQDRRPLSLAVFGPPGSGKSFGVKKLAPRMLGTENTVLEYNLSLVKNESLLIDFFHEIQHFGLRGKMPFVFWDEFDTPLDGQQFGWLRRFLAPMQDGEFQDGVQRHGLGRCVFVFAGGSVHTRNQFVNAVVGLVALKGPDFLSRIRGFLEMRGLGNQTAHNASRVRRAMTLHLLLRKHAPSLADGNGELRIDKDVFDWFMRAEYKYDFRSMEQVVRSCTIAGSTHLTSDCLPPHDILSAHVRLRPRR